MLGSFMGVADYGEFIIAIILFLLLTGPGNLTLITSAGKGGIARILDKVAGIFLMAFRIKLAISK